MVQIIACLMQWNIYKKKQSCVFVQATYLFFQLQGIQRQLFFQTTVFCVLLFLLLHFRWEVEDLVIRDYKVALL